MQMICFYIALSPVGTADQSYTLRLLSVISEAFRLVTRDTLAKSTTALYGLQRSLFRQQRRRNAYFLPGYAF